MLAPRFLPRPVLLAACAAWLLIPSIEARANDSMASLAAGGIRLTRTDAISMKSEDLYISARKVRVRYLFHHETPDPVTALMAFPMPLIPINNLDENFGFPDRIADPVNLMNFRVWADGRPITPQRQVRALVNGLDKTAILKKYAIPPSNLGGDFEAFEKRLTSLPPAARAELERNKLASYWKDPDTGKLSVTYHWDLEVIFHWSQPFPKGRDVTIAHEYTPITGAFFYGQPEEPWVHKTYCTNRAFRNAAARKLRAKGENAMLMASTVHYILTTANNWAGSIGRFHLTLDKGKPQNLLSTCWDGLRKTSPTRFEFTARNFSPKGELKVLIVQQSWQ